MIHFIIGCLILSIFCVFLIGISQSLGARKQDRQGNRVKKWNKTPRF